jgi:hypothetical protein
MSDKIKLVETDGINVIEIGKHRLYVVKNGESKTIQVNTREGQKPSWVWIPTEFLEIAKVMGDTSLSYSEWGGWTNKSTTAINKFGIAKQYIKGNKVQISTNKNLFLNGTILYVESFFEFPKFTNGYYIATVDKPQVLSAYFANYKDEFKYPGEKGRSSTHTYMSVVKLFITTHLIPNYTVGYHNFALFEVDIYCDKTKVTNTPLQFYQGTNPNEFSVNTITELNISIDEEWRRKTDHQKGLKEYHAKITTTIYSREMAEVDDDAFDLNNEDILGGGDGRAGLLKFRNKFGTVAPNGDIVAVTLTPELYRKFKLSALDSEGTKMKKASKVSSYTKTPVNPKEFSTVENNTVLKNQEVTFTVRYDDMEVILDNYEASKNNMVAVIGDVAYSKKNNEACKFSAIEVKTKGRENPITIFDEEIKETKGFFDKTEIDIGIVAGEDKQIVTITAIDLATEFHNSKNVKCLGITSSKSLKKGALKFKKIKHKKEEEFTHDTIEKVFNMNDAYVLFPEARMVTTNSDFETTGEDAIDISDQDIDFKYGTDSIDIEVEYFYNKILNSRLHNWLIGQEEIGKWVNAKLDQLWVINYFNLSEDQAQHYFIPIQTCRYPNQMVLFKVYPQINWGISFSFGLSDGTHSLDFRKDLSDKKKKLIEETQKKQEKTVNDRDFPYGGDNSKLSPEKEKEKEILNKYNLQLSVKASYDDTVLNFTPGYKGKITKFILTLLKAKGFIDEITGNSYSKKKQQTIYDNRKSILEKSFGKKDWFNKISKYPITITVHEPQFAIGMTWGREPLDIDNGYGAPVKYDMYIKASPLFKVSGSLDLITSAGFIPVAGQAIKVADIVLNVVGVEPIFKLTADGSIAVSGKGTIHKDEHANNGSIEVDAVVGITLTLEASVTVKAGVAGFIFSGGSIEGLIAENTYLVSAETGFTADFGLGANFSKGPFVDASLNFSGLEAVGKHETKINGIGAGEKETFRYTILKKPEKPLIAGTYYFNN